MAVALIEPSAASLEEMPEISEPWCRRRPGRSQHADRSVGEVVAIEAELWHQFGSAGAVNDALRPLIAERKKHPAPERKLRRARLLSDSAQRRKLP